MSLELTSVGEYFDTVKGNLRTLRTYGASALDAATEEDLKASLKAIPSDQRAKLAAALGQASARGAGGGGSVSADVLAKQNSETSQAILTCYADSPLFQGISERLTNEIMQRDKEDGDKLGSGIQKAVDKGVLPAKVDVEPTTKVSVSGKSADAVAGEIIAKLGDAPSKGCVLVLQGLSGTANGRLKSHGPQVNAGGTEKR